MVSGRNAFDGRFLIAATFLSWQSVLKNQDAYLADQARERIEFLSARLDAHVKQRISIGALVEEEWRNGLISDAKTFGFLASTKLNYFDDLQAVNWVDPNGVIRWVNPIVGNEAALNLDLRQLKILAQTLNLSAKQKDIQITPPITLAQGGKGFVGYMPIFTEGTLQGFVNIVFRTAPMIKNALPNGYAEHVQLYITDHGAEVFSTNAEAVNTQGGVRTTIQLSNRTWTVTGRLTDTEIAKHASFSAEWILFGGFGITLIVSYLVWLAMRHHHSIQSGERRFADFASVSSDWFWETDADLKFSYFSDRFEDITGVAPDELLGRTHEQTGAPGSDPSAYAEML